ncbi:CHASE2 domain-containing protein [Salinimonas lutimaris]|uniref:CHASE2 domain-containing protein n=1 Tax=Salinimonas lutimaris TaxID=914153 RepID=UPI0010C1149C|nr:CHASE2 domain-containing protein [Salinimonas lutimaris]
MVRGRCTISRTTVFINTLNGLHLIFRAALILAFYILDPFALSSASDEASADALNRFGAASYGQQPASTGHSGHNEIVVVLIDDSYLTEQNQYWPLSYTEQSKIFRQILRHEPAALFVDFLYTHDRTQVGEKLSRLTNVVQRYAAKTPIFIPQPTTTAFDDDALFNKARPVTVQWAGYGDFYPLTANNLPTPASALFDVFCQQNHDCTLTSADAPTPLYLQWGGQIHPDQHMVHNTTNCSVLPDSLQYYTRVLMAEVFWKVNDSLRQNCAYTLTLPVSSLFVSNVDDRQTIHSLLKNKIVMLGAFIQGARDTVTTPVHGKVPGVYLHAMALDNLITMQNRVYRPAPTVYKHIDITDIIDALFIFIVSLWQNGLRNRPSQQTPGEKAPWLRTTLITVLLITGILGTAIIFYQVLHIQPINWVALLILVLLILLQHLFHHLHVRRAYHYIATLLDKGVTHVEENYHRLTLYVDVFRERRK